MSYSASKVVGRQCELVLWVVIAAISIYYTKPYQTITPNLIKLLWQIIIVECCEL